MPEYVLKPFAGRWDAIYHLANLAIPFDLDGNRITIRNREGFDTAHFIRRHYVVIDDATDTLVGYGALEQQPELTHYRQFILLSSGDLWETVGQMLYQQIADNLQSLGAQQVWMREYVNDALLVAFMKARGFIQQAVVWDMRAPAETSAEPLISLGFQPQPRDSEQQVIIPDSAAEALTCAESLGFRRIWGYIRLEKLLE